jgi:hypothetical protein
MVEGFGQAGETQQWRIANLLQDGMDRRLVVLPDMLACHAHDMTPNVVLS